LCADCDTSLVQNPFRRIHCPAESPNGRRVQHNHVNKKFANLVDLCGLLAAPLALAQSIKPDIDEVSKVGLEQKLKEMKLRASNYTDGLKSGIQSSSSSSSSDSSSSSSAADDFEPEG
jgi:hypothetical protein